MALFKYTGQQFIPSCIENGIFASWLDNINDPFEGKGIRYPNRYRVVCLTASPYQMLMWAYYGNHRGCCIEFDVDEIPGIRKVEYIKEFLAHEDMDTQEVIESLYKKGNEWSHEKEYRLVYHEPSAEKEKWKRIGENVFLIAPVKQIIFGYAAEMDERYTEMLEYISEYNASHDPKIKVTKCRLKANQYRLEEDRQFDLDEELRNLGRKPDVVKEMVGAEEASADMDQMLDKIQQIGSFPATVPQENYSSFYVPADEVRDEGLSWPADEVEAMRGRAPEDVFDAIFGAGGNK